MAALIPVAVIGLVLWALSGGPEPSSGTCSSP